jgi:ATP-dependent DNA helicase HFM1/MER3
LHFYGEVGLDVHMKHVISRQDNLQVTKVSGVVKWENMYSLPAEICFGSSRTTRISEYLSHTGKSPLSKEVCVIEDDVDVNALKKVDNAQSTRKFNNLASL